MQKQSFPQIGVKESYFDFDEYFPVIMPWGRHTVKEIKETLHYHNGIELGYCHKGSGIFFVNNKILPFSKGYASIIFQNEAHIAQSHKNDMSEWEFVTLDMQKLLSFISAELQIKIEGMLFGSDDFQNIVGGDNKLNSLVYEIIEETNARKEGYREVVTALVWTLAMRLTRVVKLDADNKKGRENKAKRFKVISPALNYLSNNYFENINVTQLAKLCNLSKPHFTRLFKSVMKISPLAYLIHIRIKMAITLLDNQDDSVMEVAMKVGYNSITSFNRHFKRITRVTPSDYRAGKV